MVDDAVCVNYGRWQKVKTDKENTTQYTVRPYTVMLYARKGKTRPALAQYCIIMRSNV